MTESFDSKNDSETLVLLKERMRVSAIRDREMIEVQQSILNQLHAMDTKIALADRRVGVHSELIKALTGDCEEVKKTLKEEVKVAVETAVQNKGTMWTAVAGVVSGVPAALYAAWAMFHGGGK